jgi:fructosamine-3-kinase
MQDADISWQLLRRIVQEWAGAAAELAEVKHLVGGAINTTLLLVMTGGERAVLKISPHRVNRDFLRESDQLDLLRGLGLPTPAIYQTHIADLDNPHSYLLMEFLEGVDLGQARKQCSPEAFDDLQRHLAGMVLNIHSNTHDEYHRIAHQNGRRFRSWAEFYRYVYDPIWLELEKSPALPRKVVRQIGKVHEKLDRLIGHEDVPRLVHWDIWSTNVLARPDEDGNWRISGILDPNCKYAHAEAEIAYLELFKTVTPAFMKAYQQDQRLAEAYHRVRKPIYQLYPLINHVNLFGAAYVKPLLGALERVAPLV